MEHIAVKLNSSSIEYVCFMKLNQNVLLSPPPPPLLTIQLILHQILQNHTYSVYSHSLCFLGKHE